MTDATSPDDGHKRATRPLSARLQETPPIIAAGAHNPLSARLVEEAGFDAVWLSGFELSASFGLPDASIITCTETLNMAAHIAAAVDVPVIVDGDSGFGNAVNTMHAVRMLERAGAAAVCIEDNEFPKRCSFYGGANRRLCAVEEHALKIRACVETRSSPAFLIIARTEALIAGYTVDEALRRSRCYADAGADAVLIHSNSDSPAEVLTFAARWDRPVPLVCVPTTYHRTSVDELTQAGFRIVIFANHGLRAAVNATRIALRELRLTGRASSIETSIASLNDVYDQVRLADLKAAEAAFLPASARGASATHA